MISLGMLERAVSLTDLLLSAQQANADGCEPRIASGTWEAANDALGTVRERDMDPRRALVGEYLLFLWAMDALESPFTPKGLGRFAPLVAWSHDRGATMNEVNARYQALDDWLTDPVAPAPDQDVRVSGGMSWVRNPVGKLFVAGYRVPLAERLSESIDQRKRLMHLRDTTRGRLREISSGCQ